MAIHFQFQMNQLRSRERRIFNSVLAILTGVLTLSYPSFLYLIAGGYLIALGVLFLWVRVPAVFAVLPILAGGLIFLFPDLIPITFAAFLGFFGLILLLAFQFAFMGFLTLIFAVLIIMNPDSVAYLIAAFLLLYGVSNLIRFFYERKNGGGGNQRPNVNRPRDENEIIIE